MSFSVVFGFFIGLILALVKFDAPEMIVFGTVACTAGVYIIAIVCASLYTTFIDYSHTKINKERMESTLGYYINELDRREKEVLGVRKYLKASLKTLNDDDDKE